MGREADGVARLKRLLPWIALAAVAVALVVWFGEFGPSKQIAPRAISMAPNAGSEAVVSLDAAAPSTQESRDAPSDASRVAVLAPSDPADLAVSPHAGLWIELVFADDGAPAAGAELEVLTLAHGDLEQLTRSWAVARGEMHQSPAAPISMVLPWSAGTVGRPKVADAAGRVRLFHPESFRALRARARRDGIEYRGELDPSFREIEDSERLFRIELHPAFEARVRVLDAEGQPVREIALVVLDPVDAKRRTTLTGLGYGDPLQDIPYKPLVLAGAVTDVYGRAALFDPADRVASALANGTALAVEALGLFEMPVRAALVPGEETVLRLPPMGSVAVQVSGVRRTQWLAYADASLSLEWGSPVTFERLSRGMDGGRTRFPHVGLGLQLSAAVVGVAHGPFVFEGPTQSGQEVRFVVPEVSDIRWVQYQLVDELGVPFVDRWVAVRLVSERKTIERSQLTDGAGFVIVDCGDPSASQGKLLIQTTGAVREGSTLRTLETRVDLQPDGALPGDSPWQVGGVLVLRQLPVLTAGRVIDRSGAPVPGAIVDVHSAMPSGDREGFRTPGSEWTVSNDHGEFLLEGEAPGPDAFLVATARGLGGSLPKVLVPGERGVELVPGSAGAVRLKLVLPAGLGPLHVKGQLVRGGGTTAELATPKPPLFGFKAKFPLERDRLEPGGWTLEVLSVVDGTLLVQRDIEIAAGATADLGEIDLRERIPTLEVRATGADGQPAEWLGVQLVDEDRRVLLASEHHGPLFLPRPADGAVLEVRARGCLPGRAMVSGPILEVALAPAAVARLVLPSGFRLPRGRLPVSLFLERLSGDSSHGRLSWIRLGPQSEYPTHLGGPGRFRLRFLDGPLRQHLETKSEQGEFELRAEDLELGLPVVLPVDESAWLERLELYDRP